MLQFLFQYKMMHVNVVVASMFLSLALDSGKNVSIINWCEK